MNKEEFSIKMKAHSERFDELWAEVVKDVNAYVENGQFETDHLTNMFIDQLCLSGAWITDRINRRATCPDGYLHRNSLTKKILGYNL